MTTKLIVGLGNPGAEYEQTRHNAGWWLLDQLARQYNINLSPESKFHGLTARTHINGDEVWLLQPMQYMNRSGAAIAALAHFYKITPEHIMVLHDELDIPVGAVKMKVGGSTGGHNGLKDTQAKLGTPQFWRMRIGIDHPRNSTTPLQPVADYVLKPPKQSERMEINKAIDKAEDAISDWLAGNFERAMRVLHAK
ncbi:aminoacyl-tRNA hydrolase [Hydromonas duriensis]|uniref:Peptidyl-tRNA hydrolase n=1 Tax=Hydromonas duriensis TaxID=1527608 RepID=A0A4R6Y226_9BURK|nr:aminoacyl-tRNA hydrolase [Hydromonas duriensis]TDR30580.1 peptidyl-tRNA hydrolase [Hydromonas duriensis]